MENEQLNDILDIENSESQNSDHTIQKEINSTRNRYPALKTISIIFSVLAWIVAIASIFVFFYFLIAEEEGILSIVAILVGGLLTIGILSTSEIIKVFIDIEENTRKIAEKQN